MAETFTVDIIAGPNYTCVGSIVGPLYSGASAATAIQTAINNADSGDTIDIQAGTYPVGSQLSFTPTHGSGVTFQGTGTPVLDFTAQASGSVLITAYGTVAATLYPTTDLEHSGFSLTTTGAHGAAVDDLIFITTTTTWRNNSGLNRQGEIRRVMRVDGNTLYFEAPFEDDYPSGVTTLYRLNPIKNMTVDGINFVSTVYAGTGYPGSVGAAKNFYGFYFKYGDNIEITNCEFTGIEDRCIRCDNVVDSNVNNCSFNYSTKYGSGYGVNLVYACQNFIVEDNEAYRCRHWVASGDTGASPGVCRHIIVRDNVSEDSIYVLSGGAAWGVQHQYDSHVAGEDINYLYNEATGTGYGIYHQGYSGQIVGNNFHDLGLFAIGVGAPSFWTDEVGVSKYQYDFLIEGNTIDTTTSYGMLLGRDAVWGEVRYTSNLVISHNTITNVANYGIRAYNTTHCLINNNDFTGDGTGTGILLESTCSNVQGSENTFTSFTNNIVDNGTDNFDADGGYATIWRQSYDEIAGIPDNIHPYDSGGAATIGISDGGDYIEFTNTAANSHTGQIFGLRSQRKCRYIIDVEWTTAGTYFYIGGLYFYVYGTAPNCKLRLKYTDTLGASQYLPGIGGYDFAGDNRLTITIDINYAAWNSDETKGYAYVTAVSAGDSYGPVLLPLDVNTTRENWFRNMFTGGIFSINPENTAIFRVYSVEQQICTSYPMITIGSNKYQPYGYDGPHSSATVSAGMDALTAADKGGTIFADPTYIPAFGGGGVAYLQGLIAGGTGWDLGMHFSTTTLATCVTQYYAMKTTFGYAPKTWCWIGAAPTQAAAEYLFKNCEGLVNRHYLTPTITANFSNLPQNTTELAQNSADSGYVGTHIYVHETEVGVPSASVVADVGNSTTQFKTDLVSVVDDVYKYYNVTFTSGVNNGESRLIGAYNGTTHILSDFREPWATPNPFSNTPGVGDTFSIDLAYSIRYDLFDTWTAAVIANDLKVIGYYEWYMLHSNQIDALLADDVVGGNTTVVTATNGYNAMVLVKEDVDEITVGGTPIDFLKTEDNYVIFELNDGETAVLGGDVPPEPPVGAIGNRTILGGLVAMGASLVRPR